MGGTQVGVMRATQNGAVILVLERDQEVRDGIAALLIANGYRVIAARGEEEAILRTQIERPQLILAPVWRSDEETVAEAKQTRERINCDKHIPIVVFSAETLSDDPERDVANQVFITNPDNFNQLREFLRRVMPA